MSATVSAALNSANLKTARLNVANSLGIDPDNLTPDARTGYTKALALVVLAHPQSFSDDTLQVAQNISTGSYTMQEDASFSWSDFLAGTADNAKRAIDLGLFGKLALMVAVGGVVWFFVLPAAVKSKATAVFKKSAA